MECAEESLALMAVRDSDDIQRSILSALVSLREERQKTINLSMVRRVVPFLQAFTDYAILQEYYFNCIEKIPEGRHCVYTLTEDGRLDIDLCFNHWIFIADVFFFHSESGMVL